MNDTVQDFETWHINQPDMFPTTVYAMYRYCEETGEDFNNLYERYYEGVFDEV